jgi:hypothetical protein
MIGPKSAAVAIALLAASQSSAYGFCFYKGQLYAKTTLGQEFQDSKWVVRAKVISSMDRKWSWTLYRLRTIEAFKGHPPRYISYFTERNSGGFYLDVGAKHDVGGEYLLFLDPLSHGFALPPAGNGATVINYNCGQSGPWAAIGQLERERLDRLSGQKGGR